MGTKGTKEWANYNCNFQNGCSNDCRYCYAKGIAKQYGRATDETWGKPIIAFDKLGKKVKYREGVGMYCSTHDLTEDNYEYLVSEYKSALESGRSVLLTTKPNFGLILDLISNSWFSNRKDQILFRLTITSIDIKTQQYWEPHAPSPMDRLMALRLLFDNGYSTSVSIEPYLDKEPQHLITLIEPYVTDTIWLGLMNSKYVNNHDYEKIKNIYDVTNVIDILWKCRRIAMNKLWLKDSIPKSLKGCMELDGFNYIKKESKEVK